MKILILTLLFGTCQVQYTLSGAEQLAPQTIVDSGETVGSFTDSVNSITSKDSATVCAVVPSYDYNSPLQSSLSNILSEKEKSLFGIWEEENGVRNVLKIPTAKAVTIKEAQRYCELAMPYALKHKDDAVSQ